MTAKVPVFVENRATEYKYVRFVFYAVSHVQKTTSMRIVVTIRNGLHTKVLSNKASTRGI